MRLPQRRRRRLRPHKILRRRARRLQNPPPADRPIFKVEVIETTPLPGLDLKPEQVPAPVQTAVSADIEASGGSRPL